MLYQDYQQKKKEIHTQLKKFQQLPQQAYIDEYLFCMLTPQSNAQKSWSAIQEIKKTKIINQAILEKILRTRTRFYKRKTQYILKGLKNWPIIQKELNKEVEPQALRNYLAEKVQGYGMKEASHFLRNIGKSKNQLAILDRHIIRNLMALGIITQDTIKNTTHYKEIEQQFLTLAQKNNIPADALDMLFWSKETGKIFK